MRTEAIRLHEPRSSAKPDALEELRRLVSRAIANGFLTEDVKRVRGREQPDKQAQQLGSEFEEFHLSLAPKESV